MDISGWISATTRGKSNALKDCESDTARFEGVVGKDEVKDSPPNEIPVAIHSSTSLSPFGKRYDSRKSMIKETS